ncbi:unnamed protein product [Caenorhabditis sp. 36 PRJEB53466]|nr:unnamed protein product [Caenorhabditis sp. 36 PRJEB53466]
MGVGPRPREILTRIQDAKLVVDKVQKDGESVYRITFALKTDKTSNRFEFTDIRDVLCPLINQGKMTIKFSEPTVEVMISGADPASLKQLLNIREQIDSGADVELEKVSKVRSADFKPKTIHVTAREEYSKKQSDFSDMTQSLKIEPIDMRMPDPKWARCRNLTRLILSGNPIGRLKKNLEVFGKLKHLGWLELTYCELAPAGPEFRRLDKEVCKMFQSLPDSLTSLDLTGNNLTMFPPIFHLINIRTLNLSCNRIRYCPTLVGRFRHVSVFDVSDNELPSVPMIFRHMRTVRFFGLANNPMVLLPDHRVVAETFALNRKVDGSKYTRGGVDTLQTLAAHALHKEDKWQVFGEYFPMHVRIQLDEMLTEEVCVTAVERCSYCSELRLMRYAHTHVVSTRDVVSSSDLFNRDIRVYSLACIDCFRTCRHSFQQRIAPDRGDFFRYAL